MYCVHNVKFCVLYKPSWKFVAQGKSFFMYLQTSLLGQGKGVEVKVYV